MLKKDIRILYRRKRDELNERDKVRFHDLMLIHFQRLEINIPNIVMTYAPFENEYDPQLVEDYCLFKNPETILSLPVVNPNDPLMKCIGINDDTIYSTNKYGIPEPSEGVEINPKEIGLVIIPLLSFDNKGNRVGYGKGYYDRFLKKCKKNTLKIGFSFFDSVDLIDDTDEYDVPLDYCITPEKIYSFNI
jgi:5-formyltetrahydrofolate cyclo-ligase